MKRIFNVAMAGFAARGTRRPLGAIRANEGKGKDVKFGGAPNVSE